MTNPPEPKFGGPQSFDTNKIPFATNGFECPTLFVDIIRGIMVGPEITKMNLIQHKMGAINQEVHAIHVATLVMPTSQIRAWAQFLTTVADQAGIQVEQDAPKT